MKKWYTVIVSGHSEKLGLISASTSGEAESVEEAQFMAEGNCVEAVVNSLGEVVDFRIVAVFEGDLVNIAVRREDDNTFRINAKEKEV